MHVSGYLIAGLSLAAGGSLASVGGSIWQMRARNQDNKPRARIAKAVSGIGIALLCAGVAVTLKRPFWVVPGLVGSALLGAAVFVPGEDKKKTRAVIKVIQTVALFFAALTLANTTASALGIKSETLLNSGGLKLNVGEVASLLAVGGVPVFTALPYFKEIKGFWRKHIKKSEEAA